MFPAASVAVALNVVVLPTPAVAVRPGEKNAAAEPVATGEPVQPAVVYSFTVDPASAVPATNGVVLVPGEAGVVLLMVTRAGAVESLTYARELVEQPEVLPAGSVAVALNVVVLFAVTVTGRPGEPNADAVPVAAGGPVHPAVVYSCTVDPASAVPATDGVVLVLGEAGVVLVRMTGAGAVESLT